VTPPNGRDDDRDGEVDEAGERAGMSAYMFFIGGVAYPQLDPSDGFQIYQVMQARWVDGTPLTIGGHGLNPGSGLITAHAFAGDPVANRFWSERCPQSAANCGTPNQAGDRRYVVTTGPFELAAGASDEILLALVFGQGSDNLASITALRVAATITRNAYDAGYLDPRPVPGFDGPPAPPASVQIRRPAPNPFTESAAIRISLPDDAVLRVALVDVLGREVAVLAEGSHAAGAHAVAVYGATLAPGVYVARVWVNGESAGALPLTRR